MIGEEVKVKGRLRKEEVLEQQITPATPLAYLLPSTRGEGLLITSLTDYLLLVHNSFVYAYRSIVKGYVVLKEKQLIINGILAMTFVLQISWRQDSSKRCDCMSHDRVRGAYPTTAAVSRSLLTSSWSGDADQVRF